jgi:copper chaperone NosL
MRTLIASVSLAALLLLGACGPDDSASLPKPLEPDAQSVAYFCHMNLTEHEGPKGQAFIRGQDKPFWFASVGEAFTFLETEVHGGALQVVYVNDLGQGTWANPAPGAWIDIRKATFVIGGKVPNGMEDDGPNAAPFADAAKAAAYAKEIGGTVVDFEAAAKALSVDHPHDDSHGDDHGGEHAS